MLQAEYRDIKDLRKLEGNPRVIRDRQFKQLCESISANGDYFEARPVILSDRTGRLVIIAGNQRYEAARHLGIKSIPTILIPDLTEEREREIIIRDNVSNGEWDFDILANEWEHEELLNWGVDLPALIDKDPEEKEEKELRPYSKAHVLLSFDPIHINEVQRAISTIECEIEIEQTSN